MEEEGIGSVIKQLCFSSARRRTERGEDANKRKSVGQARKGMKQKAQMERKSEGGVEEAESSRMG